MLPEYDVVVKITDMCTTRRRSDHDAKSSRLSVILTSWISLMCDIAAGVVYTCCQKKRRNVSRSEEYDAHLNIWYWKGMVRICKPSFCHTCQLKWFASNKVFTNKRLSNTKTWNSVEWARSYTKALCVSYYKNFLSIHRFSTKCEAHPPVQWPRLNNPIYFGIYIAKF